MYDDTANGKCPCENRTACSQNNCNCSGLCGLFQWTLDELNQFTAVTVSPDPRTIDLTSYSQFIDEWLDIFTKKILSTITDGVIVMELAGLRPHFHCVFNVRDKVGFNIRLFNLSKIHNIKKHNMFKGGLHYLFKEVDKTYLETQTVPIICYEDLVDRRLIHISKRTKICHNPYTVDEKQIPKWMLNE